MNYLPDVIARRALIIGDIHLHAPHALMTTEELLMRIAEFRERFPEGIVVYAGDIGDKTGCKYKDVALVDRDIERVKAVCDHVAMGNHELEFDKLQHALIGPEDLVTHGQWVYWTIEKIRKWRKKKPGSNFLRRLAIKFYSNWRKIWQPKIKQADMQRAVALALKYGVKRVWTKHRHPNTPMVMEDPATGITLITLARGLSERWLETPLTTPSHYIKTKGKR